MTKRVAWFTGEPSVKGCFTPYKVYEVVREDATIFTVINDKGVQNYYLKKGCAHICNGDWVFANVDEEETIEREGVVALLPEDSEFEIGQEVEVVGSVFYKGLAIIKGYNYSGYPYGYILETSGKVGASPYHNGLCKDGYALWVREGGIKAIPTKTKKWSEWIENTTGKCPEGLKRKQKIKLKWSDGDEFNITDSHDGDWYFGRGDNAINITHYKVKLKDVSKDTPKAQEKPKSKWIKNTGVRPVDGNIAVMMKFSDGTIAKTQAQEYCWNLGQSRKIIKWRLV